MTYPTAFNLHAALVLPVLAQQKKYWNVTIVLSKVSGNSKHSWEKGDKTVRHQGYPELLSG